MKGQCKNGSSESGIAARTGLIWLTIGIGECGNEPSGSIKCGEFLDLLRTCWLPKKEFAP
jgi:hypothetical protein